MILVAAAGLLAAAYLFQRNLAMHAMVIAMPFMFFPAGVSINVSMADFLLPLALLQTVKEARARTRQGTEVPRLPVIARATLVALSVFASLVVLNGGIHAMLDKTFVDRLAVLDIFKLAVCIAYFLVFLNFFNRLSREKLVRLLHLWTFVASAQGLGAVLGLAPSDGTRSLGWFQDPNLFAGYLLISFVVAWGNLQILSPATLRTKFLYLFAFGSIMFGIVATGSRGALAATALSLFILVLIQLDKVVGQAILYSGFLAVTLAALFPQALHVASNLPGLERLIMASGQADRDPRLNLWSEAVARFSEQPLTGVGPGQFVRFTYGLTPFRANGNYGQVAHNSFLSYAAEGGLPVLVAFVAFVGLCAAAGWRARRASIQTNAFFVGVIGIGLLMLSLNLQNLRYVWMFLALTLCVASARSESTRPSRSESEIA